MDLPQTWWVTLSCRMRVVWGVRDSCIQWCLLLILQILWFLIIIAQCVCALGLVIIMLLCMWHDNWLTTLPSLQAPKVVMLTISLVACDKLSLLFYICPQDGCWCPNSKMVPGHLQPPCWHCIALTDLFTHKYIVNAMAILSSWWFLKPWYHLVSRHLQPPCCYNHVLKAIH